MKILLFLLLITPAIFAAELEKLSAYRGETREQDPEECYRAGWDKVAKVRHYTQQELDETKEAVKTCIGNMALISPKLKGVEVQLVEKIYEGIYFRAVKTPHCYQKMIKNGVKDTDCWRKGIDPEDRCSKDFGYKQCRIKYMDEICGKEYFQEFKDIVNFIDRKYQHPCMCKILKYGEKSDKKP